MMGDLRLKQKLLGIAAMLLALAGIVLFAIWFISGLDYHRHPPGQYMLFAFVLSTLSLAATGAWVVTGIKRRRIRIQDNTPQENNAPFFIQGGLLFLFMFPSLLISLVGIMELPRSLADTADIVQGKIEDQQYAMAERKKDAARLQQINADQATVAELITAIDRYYDFEMRAAAIDSLGRIKPNNIQAIKILARVAAQRERTDNRAYDVNELSVKAVTALGAIGAPAVPHILEMLGDKHNKSVRIQAINALGNMGPSAGEAVRALKYEMKDPDPELHKAMQNALDKIDPQWRSKP
jgi:hypothetical protein